MRLNEKVQELRSKGYTVSSVTELEEFWKNKATGRKAKVIGAYNLADGKNDYGEMFLLDNGDGWRCSELCKYWERA